MKLLLTSSPFLQGTGDINPANGFIDELRNDVKTDAKAVYITATPDDKEFTEWASNSIKCDFERAGFNFSSYDVIDRDSMDDTEKLIKHSDLVILGGGHVPTQNKFLHECNLRYILSNYDGVILGVSAGSMNCADPVYAQPEEEDESIDFNYRHFLHGMRLTTLQIIPHFQKVRNAMLDGKRIIEDITFKHSRGHQFYAIPDGSYIVSDGEDEELRGEAYLISNGKIEQICEDGERMMIL